MVGIDIGSKSIKLVSLEKESAAWVLKTSGVIGYTGFKPDKLTDEKDQIALSDIIRKLVKQTGVKSKDVNISIPDDLAFTRMVRLPYLSDEEVNSAIRWEVEQYIPIPMNEAVVQYKILERDEAKTFVSVLLVAVPKVVVEKYVNVIRLAGLMPIVAETELIALSRNIAPLTGVSMLIDIGSDSSDIGIVKNGNLSFSRSIPIGGDALSRAVSQSLGITISQAEEYKKTYGLTKDQLEGKVKNAIDPVFRIVSEEIKKAIHFFQTDDKGDAPTSILLTGGTSNLPNVVSAFTENLGIETAIADPFAKLTLDPETAKSLAPYASFYGVAVGLAMREE